MFFEFAIFSVPALSLIVAESHVQFNAFFSVHIVCLPNVIMASIHAKSYLNGVFRCSNAVSLVISLPMRSCVRYLYDARFHYSKAFVSSISTYDFSTQTGNLLKATHSSYLDKRTFFCKYFSKDVS